MDKNSGLYKVAIKFRPELAEMRGLFLSGSLLNFGQLLYSVPFTLLSVIWLLLLTEWNVVQQNGWLFLLFLLFYYLYSPVCDGVLRGH